MSEIPPELQPLTQPGLGLCVFTLREVKSIAIDIGMTHDWAKASRIVRMVDAALGDESRFPKTD